MEGKLEEHWKQIEAITKSLNKQFNTTNALVRMGDKVGQFLPSCPTGLYTLDYDVIGCGGIPKGRFIELYGPESAGKTSIALHIVGQEQKRGNLVAYIDAEHSLDPTYARTLGADMDNLIISQPDSGEQALETVDALVESGAVTMIVVDSVAALVPQAELDGEMGDAHMGLQARMMAQACRKLRGKCALTGVPVIFLNQIREKIGVMFGNPETTPGGRSLKFYASVRLDVRRREVLGPKDKPYGHEIEIIGVKNKVGAPKRTTKVQLIYDKGIDTDSDFITYAKNIGVITQAGSFYSFDGQPLGQGLDKTIKTIKDDLTLLDKIDKAVQAVIQKEKDDRNTNS